MDISGIRGFCHPAVLVAQSSFEGGLQVGCALRKHSYSVRDSVSLAGGEPGVKGSRDILVPEHSLERAAEFWGDEHWHGI